MGAALRVAFMFILVVILLHNAHQAKGADMKQLINKANAKSPFIGVLIPNLFEMDPFLQHPDYIPAFNIDFAGSRFRVATIGGKRVILVMTGLSMINAAIVTQLLLSLFNVEGVVHYGIAGTANPSLNIGDVTIPKQWAHAALWNWQKYGKGPEDELPLESDGDYTREIGYMKFANFTTNVKGCNTYDNMLNNIWYQPEEVFRIDGTPEERQHAFWVSVDSTYHEIAKELQNIEVEQCLNSTTCLPFIVFRAISGLAGGDSSVSIEADTFTPLATQNSVKLLVEFVKKLVSLTRHSSSTQLV